MTATTQPGITLDAMIEHQQWHVDTGDNDELIAIEKAILASLIRLREIEGKLREPYVVARLFHRIYEKLAPEYGYETRPDTRELDPNTPNGKLMMATCKEVSALLLRGKP